MLRRLLVTTALISLAACQDPSDQFTADDLESAESALSPTPVVIDRDSTVLVKNLDAATYKDITVSNTYLFALTTTGIKRVTHSAIGTLATAPNLRTIALDTIDYVNSTYGVVGGRSKGSNPAAAIVLRADSTSPATVNLPADITSVLELQAKQVSSTVIRLYIKTPNEPVSTTIKEFEYNGSKLTYITKIDQGLYTGAISYTFVDSSDFDIMWSSYYNTYASKQYFRPTLGFTVTEAQNYNRAYPGGTINAIHVHGFAGTSGDVKLVPQHIDYGLYNNSTPSIFVLNRDSDTTKAVIVRMDYSKLIFNKTPTYTPTYWNTSGVQSWNNCYNYGSNLRTDTYAQPGKASGKPMPKPYSSINDVINAAVSDGLEYLGNPSAIPVPPEGKSLVAAIVGLRTSVQDYHWYRKDRNTTYWSHKPGGGTARNVDFKNATITDPRKAAWDPAMYDTFVGFFLADSNWYEGQGTEIIN